MMQISWVLCESNRQTTSTAADSAQQDWSCQRWREGRCH